MDKRAEHKRVFTLVAVGPDGNKADAFGQITEWLLTRIDAGAAFHVQAPCGTTTVSRPGCQIWVSRHATFAGALGVGKAWVETGELGA